MKVDTVWQSTTTPATNPFPQERGFFFALYRGDIAYPYGGPGKGQWFPEMTFTKIWRSFASIPLPFLSWRFGGEEGYAGFKAWGMDEANPASGVYDNYRRLLAPADVYPGSQALMPSIRNGMTVVVPLAAIVALAVWLLTR